MKVCLAGTFQHPETTSKVKIPDYTLESFFYIKEAQIPEIKKCKLFLLDSGAFTFMSNSDKQVNWDDYVEKYASFVKKYDIKYFFELDIDSIVGIKEVERLRNKLEKLTERKCIPVWHKSRGLEYWQKMCENYNYVAIGGIVTKEIKPENYKYFTKLLAIAKKNNCKVHGLGFTSLKLLDKYHFYSVDSTSWMSGGRFGTLYKFNNKSLTQISFNNRRVKDYRQLDAHNLKEWIKFQEYADKYL